MRLNPNRLQSILTALAQIIGPENWRPGRTALSLYGSRIDDTKRGGDIDLLLLGSPDCLNDHKKNKRALLVAIEKI